MFRAALSPPDLETDLYGELAWRLALALGRLRDYDAVREVVAAWPERHRQGAGACYANAVEARLAMWSGQASPSSPEVEVARMRACLPVFEVTLARLTAIGWMLELGQYAEALKECESVATDRLAQLPDIQAIIALQRAVSLAGLKQLEAASEAWRSYQDTVTPYRRRDPQIRTMEALYERLVVGARP